MIRAMRLHIYSLLIIWGAAAAAAVRGADCEGINAIRPGCTSIEAPYRRDTFYVGGEYLPYSNTTQSITSGQIYVEKLTPLAGANQTYPLVFVSAAIPPGSVKSYTAQPLVDSR
jgi:hypothetical protein